MLRAMSLNGRPGPHAAIPAARALSVAWTRSRPLPSWVFVGIWLSAVLEGERDVYSDGTHDVADEECSGCVSVEAAEVDSDVDVDDIPVLQRPAGRSGSEAGSPADGEREQDIRRDSGSTRQECRVR